MGPVTSPDDLADTDQVLTELLFHELLERPIYLAPRGYIALSAAITEGDRDLMVEAVTDAVQAIE